MTSTFRPFDHDCMRRAIELAKRGQGRVEPNPMVGCVIARDGRIVAEGFHAAYGGPHAEPTALAAAERDGINVAGADMYVTLEPCCHQGKTPPCASAILAAGIGRVVIAQTDPFPRVAGGGVSLLRERGVRVDIGLLKEEARRLNAPYLMLQEHGRPWVIAKWAMTLDGKTATASGSSMWISNECSRRVVHEIRARVDAVMVGSRTAALDDPQLTVRLEEGADAPARTPVRVVWDSRASLAVDSRLVRSIDEAPVVVVASSHASEENVARLRDAGCEVLVFAQESADERMLAALQAFGGRSMTNLLVEGGGRLVGSLFDAGLIDEVHAFIAPKLIGGGEASTPIAGAGLSDMRTALRLESPTVEVLEDDVYVHGAVARKSDPGDF